jgi:hypothetical protein
MTGEPLKSTSAPQGHMPDLTTLVDKWLSMPFDTTQHVEPLGGWLEVQDLTNLQVLARLVSLNGGPVVEQWGESTYDPHAPYLFRGLQDLDEVMLLTAMINFAAGLVAAMGGSRQRLFDLINAQIKLEHHNTRQFVKH